MPKVSRIHCPKCGYNLRRLEKDSGKKKDVLYECPFCRGKWLVTIGNGTPKLSYLFAEVKKEEIICLDVDSVESVNTGRNFLTK